jgi:monothiol glutaredoxin
MNQETLKRIKEQIDSSPVLLYMKGTPQFPQCGFSGKVSHILQSFKLNFNYVNILENQDIRTTLPVYAQWPTFPQVWVNGELIGGCDIITEMYETGELAELFQEHKIICENIIQNIA